MRYRAYRREKKKVKDKKLERLSEFSGYPSGGVKMKVLENGKRTSWFDGEHDYVKRCYRGKISSYLKKQYAKRLRNGKNKLVAYNGGDYKRASGDFWWALT